MSDDSEFRVVESEEGGDWNRDEFHIHGPNCEKVKCSNQYKVLERIDELKQDVQVSKSKCSVKPPFNCNPNLRNSNTLHINNFQHAANITPTDGRKNFGLRRFFPGL